MSTILQPFSVLDPAALDGILSTQVSEWRRRLDWDLTDVANILRESIDQQAIEGVTVACRGEVVGFAFYTVEIDRVLVGDLYLSPECRVPELAELLVDGLMEQIRAIRARKRIEVQSICFDPDLWTPIFAQRGFDYFDRTYMVADAVPRPVDDHPRAFVRPWRDEDFSQLAEVIYQSYRGSVDARGNNQYRTRDGCADLLDALTTTVWCGRFRPDITHVAVDRTTGRCCGVAVASEVCGWAVHLSQISVAPIYQGEGIGKRLILGTLNSAYKRAFNRVSLAVTRANTGALALYERCGFTPHFEFSAYINDPAPFRYRPG